MSLGHFLQQVADRDPDKVFVEISGEKYTYRSFYTAVLKTASLFRDMGVGHGDRVCLFMPNCVEYLYCWFGLSVLGAIAVPINTAYKRDETAYILNNADAVGLVTGPDLIDVATAAADLVPGIRHRLVGGARGVPPLGWFSFGDALDAAAPIDTLPEVSPQDVSMLVYTSGTTGNPKGVQVTHKMYVAAGQGFAHWTQATPDDRFFTCLPYYHANVQYYSTMGALAAGATLVVVDRFSASRFWDQVREARATVVNFIGMMMPVLSKQPESPQDKKHGPPVLWFTFVYARVSNGVPRAVRHRCRRRLRHDRNLLRYYRNHRCGAPGWFFGSAQAAPGPGIQ